MRHLALLSLIMLVWACQPSITTYDVLIKNGTIYDGSGSPPITGDIAINGDTIVAIGQLKNAEGKATIDATGKAVAPGFINMLSWANVALLEDGRSQSDIRQGVTLEVMGEGSFHGPAQ
jgi:N-acyl-D-amino-acid deacylase